MDWKEYREQPDSGLFENIARRVRHRRLMRWGGAAAGVAAVVAVLCVVLWPSGKAVETVAVQQVAMQQKPVDAAPVVADGSGEASLFRRRRRCRRRWPTQSRQPTSSRDPLPW